MADAPSTAPLDAADDELEYRTMEPWAVISLLLGLVSPVAFVAPLLCLVPILAALAALVALRRLHTIPERTGRTLALVGLASGVFFLSAPAARSEANRLLLGRQARLTSDQFLAYLQEGSPEKAMVLHLAPDYRPPIDDGLWAFFRNDVAAQEMFRKLADHPAVRMVLNLGQKADVRFLHTRAVVIGRDKAMADEVYTVTFTDKDGRKKTVLVGVLLERLATENPELSPWRVRDLLVGGVGGESG